MYVPNNDNPQFFDKVRKYVEDSSETYTIVCGDLNLVLDPKSDSNNYMSVDTGSRLRSGKRLVMYYIFYS